MRPKFTCSDWIEKFYQDYLDRGGKDSTWKGEYWAILKRLPQKTSLTRDALHAVVVGTVPNTRQRIRACMVTGAIAKFAGINYDPTRYKGKYSSKTAKVRDLPDDQVIVQHFSLIPNPGWAWAYGIMATYGLRPHECFRLDFDRIRSGDAIIQVGEDTKTGAREVWPFPLEWVSVFTLQSVRLPEVDLSRTNESLGRGCSKYFREHCPLPFKPYDLRHAWAVRACVEFNFPDALAARQMGHSLLVHNQIYQRWVDRKQQQKAYDEAMRNRPIK